MRVLMLFCVRLSSPDSLPTVGEADWQLMPTLDYYGFEHEDAINGIVAEYDGQPFARYVHPQAPHVTSQLL
jgi:hypothetical protein